MFARKKDLELANIRIDFLRERIRKLEDSMELQKNSFLPEAVLESTHEKCSEYKNAYSIEKLYANAGVSDSDKNGLAEARLVICLEASDWYKFQSQSFYQELIEYLDNLEIQKTHYAPE